MLFSLYYYNYKDFNVSSGEDDGGNGGGDDECHSDTMITNNVDESKPVGSGESSTSDVVENELGNYDNNNTETNSLHVSRDNQCLESETDGNYNIKILERNFWKLNL